MAETDKLRGAVLIVTTNRDDRRVLFDTLDAHEFEAIYTAKDMPQAHSFLEQETPIDVVLLEFLGEARDAVNFCNQLQSNSRSAKTPIIGILVGDEQSRQWGWQHAPAGVVDWLRTPVDAAEAFARVRVALANRAEGNGNTAVVATDRYQFAFDLSQDELVVSDPKTGRILDVNPMFEQRSGMARAQAVGSAFEALDMSHDREQRRMFMSTLAREGQVRYRSMKPRAKGTPYAVDVNSRLTLLDGKMACFSQIREAGELATYQSALTALVGLGEAGVGDECVERAVKILAGWLDLDYVAVLSERQEQGEPQVLATHARISQTAEVPDPLKQVSVRQVLDGQEICLLDHAFDHAGNEEFLRVVQWQCWVGLPLRDERRNVIGGLFLGARKALLGGEPVLAALKVAALRLGLEIELRRAREQGRAKGLQDVLTGLPNRLLYNDRLETTIKEAHRTGEMFAVLFVDLDRFKTINDSLGHGVGDEVLIGVSKRLRASIRGSDTVARYAGDEFTLILRHIVQRDDVLRIAEKIIRVMEAPLTMEDGGELHITASIGISFYPDDANTGEKLLKHADVAMYSAKGMGRNNYQTYVAVPEESHQQRLALESKLRVAEKNNEFRVYFQPQVDAHTEDLVGMEALIRWEHPELGMISPGFFIPLAEESGLIVSIGEWVLRAACIDAKRWQDRFNLPLRLSVNLSALQLRQPNLVEVVTRVIKDVDINPELLDLEVTESINVKSIPNLIETLQALRDMGCKISIDDFGTGQSSLDYLKRFPADRIKIDQTFVRNIGVDPDDEAIVKSTINMAHDLNRGVIAEGVEIEEHLQFLRENHCEELQGYLFCRPLPAASFENLLIEREKLFRKRA